MLTLRPLLATALLGIATLAQAALCIPGPAQGVPGTGFTPFASLERLEVRAGRPGNQDWEWGLGTNTQQAGQFVTAQLNWVNDQVYSYTLTYNGAGAATLTVSDGSTTLFTRSWATGMDTGNALRFYIKANAGIGADNRISATITAINGQAVNESLATSGNNLFEEQARFFASEGLRTGFTVEGTVKLTFTGSAPPQGSRLNLMVNAGNIACETQANAQLYFIHTDHLNTPRLITNTVGLPVWRWDNDDPYGNNAPNENPAGAGQFTCNLRLPGQYFDAELNTHYNYFRDYDPVTGRYVQSDPIGLAGGINTYLYVIDPLTQVDPFGLMGRGAGIPSKSAQKGPKQPRFPGSSCGPAGDPNNFPSNFGAWSFEKPCQNHDACYCRCGAPKAVCDRQFYKDMIDQCNGVQPSAGLGFARIFCKDAAHDYFMAVVLGGASAYNNAQAKCKGC